MSPHEEQSGMSPLQHRLPAEFHSMLHSQDPDQMARLFVMGERAGDLLSVIRSSAKPKIQVSLSKQAADEDDDDDDDDDDGAFSLENEDLNPTEENRVEIMKELAAGLRTLFGKISKGAVINAFNQAADPKQTQVYQALMEYRKEIEDILKEETVAEDPEIETTLGNLLEKMKGDLSGNNKAVKAYITYGYLANSTDPSEIKRRLSDELFPFVADPFTESSMGSIPEEKPEGDSGESREPELSPEQKKQINKHLLKKKLFHPKNFSGEELSKDEDLQANVSSFTQLSHALGVEDRVGEDDNGKTVVSRPEKPDILIHELATTVEKAVPEWDASTETARENIELGLQKGLTVITGSSLFRNLSETPHELLGSMVNYISDPHNMHALLQAYRQQGHVRTEDVDLPSKAYKPYKVQHHIWLGAPHPGDTNFSAESKEELAAMSQDLQDYVNSNEALYASALLNGEVPHPTGDIEIRVISSPTISGSAAIGEAMIAKVIRIGNKRYSSTDTSGEPTEDYSPSKNPEKVYDSNLMAKKASLSTHSISTNITAAAKDLLKDYERLAHVVTAPTEEGLTELFTKWYAVTALFGKCSATPESLVQLYADLFKEASTSGGSAAKEESMDAFLHWVSSPGKTMVLPRIGTNNMVYIANKLVTAISSAFENRANKNAHTILTFIENQSAYSKDRTKGVGAYTQEAMEALPHIMAEDMMVKNLLNYSELKQAIHEGTSGSMDRLKVVDALNEVFGEIGKKGWDKAVNDYTYNPAENELISAIVRIGSILIESRDPSKVAIGSSLVNNPGPRAAELVNIIKTSLMRNLSNGKITSNTILSFENMFGHGGKSLHTSKNKQESKEVPVGTGTGVNRNALYVRGDWDKSKGEAHTSIKVGQTYRLVYEPNWQERLHRGVNPKKDSKKKNDTQEEQTNKPLKGGSMDGFLFSIKGNAPVVHIADRRLGINEVPRFVEFAAKRFAATKLGGGSSAGRRVSTDMMDDEGNSTNLLDNLPEDIINSYISKSDWDANSGIKRALRGKPFKVVRETLRSMKDRNLLKLDEVRKHGSYQANSDGSITKRPSMVNSERSDRMLETGPSASEIKLSELNQFITRLTRKLPTVSQKDLTGKDIQETMALLSTSQQVASIFLEDALDPDMNLGKTGAIMNKSSRKQYHGADFDHLAWFDGALRSVMKNLGVDGVVEQISDMTRKGEFVAGNPARSLVSKMVDRANVNLSGLHKLPEVAEKWQEAAQKWNSEDRDVKFEDMFKTTAEKSLRSNNTLNSLDGILKFFNEIQDVSSNGASVQDHPDFKRFFQVVNTSSGPSVEYILGEDHKPIATAGQYRQLSYDLLNDANLGESIEARLDKMGVRDTYLRVTNRTFMYEVRDTANPAQIAKFISSNAAHGQIGKILLSYGGKDASYNVATLEKEVKRKEKNNKKTVLVNPATGEEETDSLRWKTQIRAGFDAMCKALAKVSGGLKALKNTHGGIISAIERAVEQEASMKSLGDPTALFRGFVVKCLSSLKTLKQNQSKREETKGTTGRGAPKKDYDSLLVQNEYIGDHMPRMFLDEVHSNINRKKLLDILKETITAKSNQDKELRLTDATLQKYRNGLVGFFSDSRIAEIMGS